MLRLQGRGDIYIDSSGTSCDQVFEDQEIDGLPRLDYFRPGEWGMFR